MASMQVAVEVRNVLDRYCRAVDRCDWDLLRSVYHSDAHIDHGAYCGGVSGFVDFVRGRRVGIVHSAHYISNLIVEAAGPDRVMSEAYGWATQTFRAPSSLVEVGHWGIRQTSTYRYIDLFEQRAGAWAVAEAHLVLGDLQVVHLDVEPPARQGLLQRPGPEDTLYHLRDRWIGS